MAFLLHELSKSEQVQKDLEEDFHTTETIEEQLKNFKLGKSIVKENFRLHPISVGIGRTLASDAIFSGYHVPKGTLVVTQNQVSSRLPNYCPLKANEFWPYRYLQSHNTMHFSYWKFDSYYY